MAWPKKTLGVNLALQPLPQRAPTGVGSKLTPPSAMNLQFKKLKTAQSGAGVKPKRNPLFGSF